MHGIVTVRDATEEQRSRRPASSTAHEHAHRGTSTLQSALGNRALTAALRSTATAGVLDDPLERDADRAADDALRAGASSPVAHDARPAQHNAAPAPAELLRSSGRALDDDTRRDMEARFARDLGAVRVHDDDEAAGAATALDARAFTVGDHIGFGLGEYRPSTDDGRRLIAHELAHTIQQANGMRAGGAALVQRQVAAGPTPQQTVDKYITFFLPDYAGLAADLLARLPAGSAFVNKVYDILSDNERTVVSSALASQATDDQLAKIAADPGGRSVLWRTFNAMTKLSSIDLFEKDQERVLFAISPEHKRLKTTDWGAIPEVKAGLKASGATIQSIGSGWASGLPQFDEYSVTMESMPPNLTPEAFLAEMADDLNKAVNDYWFDAINEFKRTSAGRAPAVGDVYNININGPDNGSVMLVESKPDHFVFTTVTTAKDGTHPEYGSREFGFERNADGSVRFFTRGASRSGMLPGTTLLGRPIQKVGWTRLVTGIANALVSRGGKMRAGSIRSWRSQE